jgi:protein SCO1/2
VTSSPVRWLVLAVAFGFCVAAAALAVRTTQHAQSLAPDVHYAGTPIVPPKPVEDFVLTDASGHTNHLLERAPLEFLFFGYTHCPDECPLAMGSLAHAYRSLAAASRAKVRVVFVTVDPKRDTPAVLKRYLTGFDPSFIGLTGSVKQLQRVWKSYGVQVDEATKEIGHGDAIYAIDANHRAMLIYTPEVPASDLASDAAKLTT